VRSSLVVGAIAHFGVRCWSQIYMKTALVTVAFPYGAGEQAHAEQQKWRQWSEDADLRIPRTGGTERLDQSVWLIDASTGLHFLCWLVASAQANKWTTRVSSFDSPIVWSAQP
jgi:hypothetical protein